MGQPVGTAPTDGCGNLQTKHVLPPAEHLTLISYTQFNTWVFVGFFRSFWNYVQNIVNENYLEKSAIKNWDSHYKGCCCCSVTQLCLTLCGPMDCCTPSFPVLHYLPEFAQTHVHWIGDAIQPSHSSVALFSSCPQSFPGSFPMSQLFTSGGQSIRASVSASSVLPRNSHGWFPLGLTGLMSLLS